jgi:hypothetical protein
MNKADIAFLTFIVLMIIGGCVITNTDADAVNKEYFSTVESFNSAAGVIVDNYTGCKYIVNWKGGITPLLNEDGIPQGCKNLGGTNNDTNE